MRVVHLNTNLHGGAAIAALRVHESVRLAGCRSTFLHLGRERLAGGVEPFSGARSPTLAARLRARLRFSVFQRRWRPDAQFDFYPVPRPGAPWPDGCEGGRPDLLHLHWMQGWLAYDPPAAGLPPVVVTLHDMNAFTGGCIYDWDCGRFVAGCGSCPQLGRRGTADISRWVADRKKAFWSRLRLHVVAPSRWMLDAARRSAAMGGALSFTHIPYGLNLDAFQPLAKPLARQALRLPEGRIIVLYGAAGGSADRRKGFELLRAGLARLSAASPVRLLTFGSAPPDGELPPWVERIHLGTLASDRLQSLVYSAADLTVVPSLQDNSPQVVLESLACATPVLGTEVGGIPEQIVPDATGCLCPPEPEALALALRRVMARPAMLEAWGPAGRRFVEEHHGLARQGDAYLRLYREALSGKPGA